MPRGPGRVAISALSLRPFTGTPEPAFEHLNPRLRPGIARIVERQWVVPYRPYWAAVGLAGWNAPQFCALNLGLAEAALE